MLPSSRFKRTISFLRAWHLCADPDVGVGSLLYRIHSCHVSVPGSCVFVFGCGAYQVVDRGCAHGVDDVEQQLQGEDNQEERRHVEGWGPVSRCSVFSLHRVEVKGYVIMVPRRFWELQANAVGSCARVLLLRQLGSFHFEPTKSDLPP